MQQEITRFPEEIYSANLQMINHIKFSRREVDIIASLLSGKGTKEIAAFLSIAPRTVDNVLYIISKRINVKTRQEIIEFIKQAPEFHYVQEYYRSLSLQVFFEKELSRIFKFSESSSPVCSIVYEHKDENISLLIQLLKKHLEFAGIKASIITLREQQGFIDYFKLQPKGCQILLVSEVQFKQILANDEIKKLITKHKDKSQLQEKLIFLITNFKESISNSSGFQTEYPARIINSSNYYSCVLDILNYFLPECDLSTFKIELEQQWSNDCKALLGADTFLKRFWLKFKLKPFIVKKKMLSILAVSSGLCILLLALSHINELRDKIPPTRSDLPIPKESAFLQRPLLVTQIDKALNSQKGIQVVALVGIGGAGKTTLARQYARNQKLPIIWEINAETRNTLMVSFENLAHGLTQSTEEKKIIKEIQEIKNTQEKEYKLFKFIKNKLQLRKNWLLIYDNVEKFSDIQKYFPYDSKEWGTGGIILTSKNKNIGNSKYINQSLSIKDLSFIEKEKLFLKIIKNEESYKHTKQNYGELKQFLGEIPPFPLDISAAAFYIKSTNISYKEYLRRLNELNHEFITTQEYILKEASDYSKTRYGIITLSLKKIIEANHQFKYLFLFISLLDSQNIPRTILDEFMNDVIVDNFLIQLNKYCLISASSSSEIGTIFSLHRSTQKIIFNYLEENLKLTQGDQILESLLLTFEKYMNDAIERKKIHKMRILANHAESLLKRKALFSELSIARMRGELAALYHHLSNYQQAKRLLKENFNILNTKKFQNSNVFARTLTYLSSLSWRFGDFTKGLDLSLKSQNIHYSNDTKDYQGLVKALTLSGMNSFNLGKDKEALSFFEKALLLYNEHLPENYIEKSYILSCLGQLLIGVNFSRSKAYLEESIDILKRHSPHSFSTLFEPLTILGWYHSTLGEYEKAVTLHKKVWEMAQALHPENSAIIGWAARNLGSSYCSLGNFKKAEPLLQRSYKIFEDLMGTDNIKTKWSLYELGTLYLKLKELQKAKEAFESCLEVYKKNYGSNSIYVARILRDLGKVYLLEGNLEKAEQFLQDALILYKKTNPFFSFSTLEVLSELYLQKSKKALPQEKSQFKKQAITYLTQALAILKQNFPVNCPHFVRVQEKIKSYD